MLRPLLYMNKKNPFAVFFSKKAGSGDKLAHALKPEGTLPPLPSAKLITAGGTDSVPAVILLAGTFLGTETLTFTSVTDGQTTPVTTPFSCPAGKASVVAAAAATFYDVQVERDYTGHGNLLECIAVAPSTTVTLSAVSLT